MSKKIGSGEINPARSSFVTGRLPYQVVRLEVDGLLGLGSALVMGLPARFD
jgi:hypothetical protein